MKISLSLLAVAFVFLAYCFACNESPKGALRMKAEERNKAVEELWQAAP